MVRCGSAILKAIASRQVRLDLTNLKRILESGTPVPEHAD
jgi:hypothetical protein